jgi:hypothetical protein
MHTFILDPRNSQSWAEWREKRGFIYGRNCDTLRNF